MIQSIINTLYRYPKSQYRTWQKFGGYFAYKAMFVAEKEMQKAALDLVVDCPKSELPTLDISFLTGKKYWYQTVFCAYSLQKVTPNPIHFTFYDDGSLLQIPSLKQQVPNSTIVSQNQILENLNAKLPQSKFPYLHRKREEYKHIRKLTDVYTHKAGWQLMLDSDMLFWKIPTQILDWLQNPQKPFYILDSDTAYGYPLAEMGKMANATIKEKINVGALGLNDKLVDFEKLEHWAKNLETNFGTSYYLEQALSAMLIGELEGEIGLEKDYIVYPTRAQVEKQEGILHHYVDVSKKWYFDKAWKKLI